MQQRSGKFQYQSHIKYTYHMRLRSGLLIGIFGLIVVLMGGWFFTLATAMLTYLALLEFFRMA